MSDDDFMADSDDEEYDFVRAMMVHHIPVLAQLVWWSEECWEKRDKGTWGVWSFRHRTCLGLTHFRSLGWSHSSLPHSHHSVRLAISFSLPPAGL